MEKAICHSVIILIGQEIGTVYKHQVTRALRDTVDDGYHLQIPFLHTLRQTTGVLAGPVLGMTEEVTVIKFSHMSSDLLAYGASDGSLTVCTVSTPPSVLKQFTGHTKDVTGVQL
ncbi:hypothetical protein ACS0TY_021464 [Phlomoides rotata]